MSTRERTIWGVVGIITTALLMEAVARSGIAGPIHNLPLPTAMAGEVVDLLQDPGFRGDVVFTVTTWVLGMALAAVTGVLGGLALGTSPVLERAVTIPVEFLRPLPSVAIGPLLLLFVGSGLQANALTVAYAAVWPVLFNVLYGVRSVDPTRLDTARILRWSRLETARRVRLPSTAPFALTGLRVAASIGLIVTISVELLIGSGEGIGGFILRTSAGGGALQTTYAATLIGGVIGWAVSSVLLWIHVRRYRWAVQGASA